ncbi:hypothetical protein CRE_04396 [Caenorhabditis remanei]|uniref:F-box domain-containing protein n=1 Tax=Caenorhabditis remanei TaxID=31234 RepID=E3NLV1_CAERE|nr:hypothetical protein CRE_04396 [Caenorhabditis remanei]
MNDFDYLVVKYLHQKHTCDLLSERFTTLRTICHQNESLMDYTNKGREVIGYQNGLTLDFQNWSDFLKSEKDNLPNLEEKLKIYKENTNVIEKQYFNLMNGDIKNNIEVMKKCLAKGKYDYYNLMDSLYDRISYNSNLSQMILSFKSCLTFPNTGYTNGKHSYGFSFLKLPLVARDHVIRMMSFVELIQLSRCSEKTKSIIYSLSFPNILSLDLVFRKRQNIITPDWNEYKLCLKLKNSSTFNIIVSNRHQEDGSSRSFNDSRLGYRRVEILELKKSINIVCENGTFSFFIYLVDFLSDVLRMTINNVYIDLRTLCSTQLHSFFCWKSAKLIKNLSIENGRVRSETLTFIFKSLSSLKSLHFSCGLEAAKLSSPLIVAGCVKMLDGRWMTCDALIKIYCEELLIYFNKLTCTDINLFIKNWINSNDTTLRVFQVAGSHGNDTETLFRGLEDLLKPWNKSERGPIFETQAYALDCQNGLDIQRSDGLIATLCVDESVFSFVVWHDRFPQVTKQLPSPEKSILVQFLAAFLRSTEWYQVVEN